MRLRLRPGVLHTVLLTICEFPKKASCFVNSVFGFQRCALLPKRWIQSCGGPLCICLRILHHARFSFYQKLCLPLPNFQVSLACCPGVNWYADRRYRGDNKKLLRRRELVFEAGTQPRLWQMYLSRRDFLACWSWCRCCTNSQRTLVSVRGID